MTAADLLLLVSTTRLSDGEFELHCTPGVGRKGVYVRASLVMMQTFYADDLAGWKHGEKRNKIGRPVHVTVAADGEGLLSATELRRGAEVTVSS